jgi:hypothetical protein
MSLLSKILAFILFPFGIFIILEHTKLYNLPLPFDKALIGAILMVVTQAVTLISLKIYSGELGFRNYLSTVLLLSPAFYYFLSLIFTLPLKEVMPIILGVTMFVEGTYAFN